MNLKEESTITIESVGELVETLIEEDKSKYTEIIHSLDIPNKEFEQFCSWSEDSYTRNCIIDNSKFELILLCWEEGQVTPIHDHGGEECWVKIIKGEFKEKIYQLNDDDKLEMTSSSIAKKNDVSYMVDFMGFHNLENRNKARSMSLHLYAKPIRNCRLFDEKSSKFVSKDLEYDTISELVSK